MQCRGDVVRHLQRWLCWPANRRHILHMQCAYVVSLCYSRLLSQRTAQEPQEPSPATRQITPTRTRHARHAPVVSLVSIRPRPALLPPTPIAHVTLNFFLFVVCFKLMLLIFCHAACASQCSLCTVSASECLTCNANYKMTAPGSRVCTGMHVYVFACVCSFACECLNCLHQRALVVPTHRATTR